MQKKGYIMIALAGTLWGTLGMFGSILFRYGLSPQLVVFCRLFFGTLLLLPIILFKDKKLLKIDVKGIKYTAFMGLFLHAISNLLYFECIKRTTIATAVILLYTSPIFLTIMGKLFYKEKITIVKSVSLVLCIIGSFLTVTGAKMGTLSINIIGILIGIGAGFNYAFGTIVSKAKIKEYHPFTIIFYSFCFGWILLIPFAKPLALLHFNYDLTLVLSILGLGFIPSVMSYILYITGLSCNIEASKAGIICSLEIIVSVIISFLFFNENIIGFKIMGIVLVLASIVIIGTWKDDKMQM